MDLLGVCGRDWDGKGVGGEGPLREYVEALDMGHGRDSGRWRERSRVGCGSRPVWRGEGGEAGSGMKGGIILDKIKAGYTTPIQIKIIITNKQTFHLRQLYIKRTQKQ